MTALGCAPAGVATRRTKMAARAPRLRMVAPPDGEGGNARIGRSLHPAPPDRQAWGKGPIGGGTAPRLDLMLGYRGNGSGTFSEVRSLIMIGDRELPCPRGNPIRTKATCRLSAVTLLAAV